MTIAAGERDGGVLGLTTSDKVNPGSPLFGGPISTDGQYPETQDASGAEEAAPPEAIECYIDDKKVSESEVESYSRDHLLGVFGAKDDPKDRVLRLHYFSTKDRKLEFADAEDIPLRQCEEAEAHLAQYAESSGAICAFEETGVVPEEFTSYSARYTAQMFPELAQARNAAALSFGHYGKDLVGGPTLLMLGGMTPYFALGWNNVISRYYVYISPLLVWSYIAFFDKAFYHDKFYATWSWNHNTVYFSGPLSYANDRATSVITF